MDGGFEIRQSLGIAASIASRFCLAMSCQFDVDMSDEERRGCCCRNESLAGLQMSEMFVSAQQTLVVVISYCD
jgi:hypothetical protein